MDRLTGKHYDRGDYYMVCSGSCANDDEMCGGCPWLEKIINRLGSYEDTGLEPDEIEKAMAISALREQEERENPRPLTLAELREMAQRCEGVYVAHVDGSPVFRGKRYCAAVLDFSPAFGSNTLHVHAIYGDRLTLWEDDYGKTWLAYRSKPKDDGNDRS